MRNISSLTQRRDFLKGAGLFGLGAAVPPILAACGGGSNGAEAFQTQTPTPTNDGRETRHLHFDFSLAPVAEPRLFALRSQHHGAVLQVHTDQSRQQHRAINPALADVADGKLTHLLADADVPADALQTVMVLGTDPGTGLPVLAGMSILVPSTAQQTVATRRATQGVATPPSAKRQAYGVGLSSAAGSDFNAFTATPWDTAAALVFHHPAIMNLKPDLGADILDRIQGVPCATGDGSCTPYLGTLAAKIAQSISAKGYPTTSPGGWATLVPQILGDQPLLGPDGKPVYRLEISDDIAAAIGAVAQEVIRNISDDPLFEGINWHATTGIVSAPAMPAGLAAVGGSGFGLTAQHPVGSTLDGGIEVVDLQVMDAASRRVRLTVRNRYLRFLSVYVQYQDDNGTPLPISNPGSLDTGRAQYLTVVGSDSQLMGIPFQGTDAPTSDLEFTIPGNASKAQIMFGSLGKGGDPFTQEAVAGSAMTLALNIGLPAICLAIGVYLAVQGGINAVLEDEPLLTNFAVGLVKALGQALPPLSDGIYSAAQSQSVIPFLTSAGSIAINVLTTVSPKLALTIFQQIGSQQLIQFAAPVIDLTLKVLAIDANIVELGFVLDEVFTSPAITTNTISSTMDTTVRISRDPRDYQFPASATRYKVEAYYDGGAVPRYTEGPITQGQVDPIDAVLEGVPSGGTVRIKVALYSDAQMACLVGIKQMDPIKNMPDTASLIQVQIVELVAALTPDTFYVHTAKLGYANGARTWNLGATAPTANVLSLCQGGNGAICSLNGLTLHTASGMAGYGFNAGGQNVQMCGGSGEGGSLNTIQNVFLGSNPERALKFSGCGYTQPMGILYDDHGPAVGGYHFFVQPAADGFHVRRINLDNTTPFDMNQSLSWGRFSTALDSFAMLPSGYVVGVNRQTHKMEILLLPREPVDQATAPNSVPFACFKSGLGTRAGLMDTPVAVSAFGNAILVLEQGNKRIQAFDTKGNPVLLFKGKTSSFVQLAPPRGAVYLDLAVESLGHMYVLSYTSPDTYMLDIYTPDGAPLSRTSSVMAARLAVDLFRNVYTLNYEPLAGSPRVEPSLSQWSPREQGQTCTSTLPPQA